MNKSITELTAEAVTALLAQSQGTSPDMTLESFGFFLDDYVILGGDMTVKTNDPNHFSVTEIVVSFNDLLLRLPGKSFTVRDNGINTYFLDFTMENGFVLSKVHPNVPYLPLWVINTNASGDITATTDQRGDMGYVRFRSEIAGLVQDNIVVDEMHIADNAVSSAKLKDSAVTTAKINAASVNLSKLAPDVISQLGGSGTGAIGIGSVVTSMLADGAVTTAKLADGTVTEPKIPDGTVTLAKLGNDAKSAIAAGGGLVDGAITTARLADGAVTSIKITNNSVTASKIADGAVTAVKIPNASITSAKLAADVHTDIDGKAPIVHAHTIAQVTGLATELEGKAGAIHGHSIAQVTGLQAALDLKATSALATVDTDGLMSGPDKLKLDSIGGAGGSELLDGAVTTAKLADGAVTSLKLAALSVGAGNIQDASISDEKLAAGSVNATHIQADAVTSAGIIDGAVTTSKIAGNAVTGTKIAPATINGSTHIADVSIPSAKLADFAVTNLKLSDSAVATAKLADSAVTNAKIANSTISKTKLDTTLQASIGNNKIDGLADVDNTAKADGRILKWNATALKHQYIDPPTGGTGGGTLSGLSDVDSAAKADNKALVWSVGTGKHVYAPFPTGSATSTYGTADVRKDYAAVGNGTTSDTAAITNALNYLKSLGGGTLLIPKGTYNLASWGNYTVTFPLTIVMQKGAVLKGPATTNFLTVKANFSFDGGGGTLDGFGCPFDFTGNTGLLDEIIIKNGEFLNHSDAFIRWSEGAAGTGVKRMTIQNNKVNSFTKGKYGILLSMAKFDLLRILDNDIEGVFARGMYVGSNATDFQVTRKTVFVMRNRVGNIYNPSTDVNDESGRAAAGIQILAQHVYITDNYVYDVDNYAKQDSEGIYTKSKYGYIARNQLYNAGGDEAMIDVKGGSRAVGKKFGDITTAQSSVTTLTISVTDASLIAVNEQFDIVSSSGTVKTFEKRITAFTPGSNQITFSGAISVVVGDIIRISKGYSGVAIQCINNICIWDRPHDPAIVPGGTLPFTTIGIKLNTDDILCQGNLVEGCTYVAINVGGSKYDNIGIKDNIIRDIRGHGGISTSGYGSHHVITGNQIVNILNNLPGNTQNPFGINIGGYTTNAVIGENLIENVVQGASSGSGGGVIIAPSAANRVKEVVIRNNVISDCLRGMMSKSNVADDVWVYGNRIKNVTTVASWSPLPTNLVIGTNNPTVPST